MVSDVFSACTISRDAFMKAPDKSSICKICLKNLQIGLLQLAKGAPMEERMISPHK